MEAGQPSQTAIGAAAFRVLHGRAFDGPAIHHDEYALELVGVADVKELAALMRATGLPELERVCAYFAFRHRYVEELMLAAAHSGVRQLVVLGAGLDTFALRYRDLPAGVEIYEVDHPATQAWKQARLEAVGLRGSRAIYVAVDFETDSVADRLEAAGFRFADAAFFSWLGVSQYVDRAAAAKTFDLVTSAAAGSQIVFDVVLRPAGVDSASQALSDAYAAASAERGEPWISTYVLADLKRDLRGRGLARVSSVEPDDAERRYYMGQPPGITPPAGWRLAHATHMPTKHG